MSVVDANLPIFHLIPSRTSPTSESVVAHSQNGSTPSPQYLKRRDPTTQDTYTLALRDAHYPDIVYASVSTPALYPQPHRPSLASSSNPQDPPEPPKVPAAIPITLYNPTSRVLLKQRPSSWGAGPFWEFSMPKTSFLHPTGSLLDQTVGASRLAIGAVPLATFRWRKEGGMLSRSSLRCSLIHPSNVSLLDDGKGNSGGGSSGVGLGNINGGNGGAKEPDITVAIFTNGISGGKPGKGEITLFEPSLKRVEVEDLKGLEVMLIMSACVIADVWFSDMRLSFNLTPERIPGNFAGPGRTATLTPQQMAEFAREDQMVEEMERARRERIVSPAPVPVEEALPAYTPGVNGGGYPREKQRPTQGQLLSQDYQARLVEHQRRQELEAQRLQLERQRQQQEQQRLDLERQKLQREAEQEAAARRLQKQFEEEARREQEKIDAETARLIQLEMMNERQQQANRRGGGGGAGGNPHLHQQHQHHSQPMMSNGRPIMPPRPQQGGGGAGTNHAHHQHSSSYPSYNSNPHIPAQPSALHPQGNYLQPKKSGWFGSSGGSGGKKLDSSRDHRKSFMGLRVFGDGNASGSSSGSGGGEVGKKEQKKLAKKKSGMW